MKINEVREDEHQQYLAYARQAIMDVALQESITAKELYSVLKLAITAAYESQDSDIQNQWSAISKMGELPTPEEFIVHCAELTDE